MRIQSQSINYFNANDEGWSRKDGLMLGIIEWWVRYHPMTDDLRKIANGCDFSGMRIKSRGAIGKIVLDRYDFWTRFLGDVYRDPSMSLLMKIIMEPELNLEETYLKVHNTTLKKETDKLIERLTERFQNRFINCIGYQLIAIGWWKENEKRIQRTSTQCLSKGIPYISYYAIRK